MTPIELNIEFVDNGAIIRYKDCEDFECAEVVEGKDDKVAEYLGKFITGEMVYASELKAKVKIEIDYEREDKE